MKLTAEEIAKIENLTIDLLRENYGPIEKITAPIRLNKIFEKYGLELKVGDLEEDDVSGVYDREKKLIVVSEDEPYHRQIFTVAHELGHYFLHKDMQWDIFYRKDLLEIGEQEKQAESEANWFAASILMPKFLIENYAWAFGANVTQIADLFEVSNTAAMFRLKNLDLIKS